MPETIVGDDYVPRRRGAGAVSELTGVPASRGTYVGQVRVIRSTAEFDRMEDGVVLVIPHSDVAWTPLFARAGAVVAESGGLPDDAQVHVDGYRGTVTVLVR